MLASFTENGNQTISYGFEYISSARKLLPDAEIIFGSLEGILSLCLETIAGVEDITTALLTIKSISLNESVVVVLGCILYPIQNRFIFLFV